jgi:hypothetical protein
MDLSTIADYISIIGFVITIFTFFQAYLAKSEVRKLGFTHILWN